MPTYVYETVPRSESEEPMQFEVWQKMSDDPLTEHPETGQAVQKVITGGLSIMTKQSGGSCCQSKCSCG